MSHTHLGYSGFEEEQEILEAIRKAYRHDHNIVTLFVVLDRLRSELAAKDAPDELVRDKSVPVPSWVGFLYQMTLQKPKLDA